MRPSLLPADPPATELPPVARARRRGWRLLHALVRQSVRHPVAVLAAWLLAMALAVGVLWQWGPTAFTTDVQRQDGSDSALADALLRRHFPQHAAAAGQPNEVVVIHSATLTVDDPAYAAQVQAIADRLTALGPGILLGGRSYFLDGDASLVSADRRATLVPLVVHDAPRHVAMLRQTLHQASAGSALQATLVGHASVGLDYRALADHDLRAELRIGLPAALLVLLLVFGSVVAALLPVLVAAAAIVVALAMVVALAQLGPAFQAYFLVTNMVVMMGLAVGIDYALFVLARWREEHLAGRSAAAAVLRSGHTAGHAIVWSGATVVVALLGLLLVPTNVFHGLALGAIAVVAVAVLAALTLLPALLQLLGPWVDRWRLPLPALRRSRPLADRPLPLAVRRPWASGLLAVGLLAALAAPGLQMRIGFAGIDTLPEWVPARQAFQRMQQSFRIGVIGQAMVVVHGPVDQPAVGQALLRLRSALAADPAFIVERLSEQRNADGTLRVLAIPMPGDAESDAAQAGIQRLRQQWLPQAFAGVSAEVRVTGAAAGYLDFFALTRSHAPGVVAMVLSLSFVLLALAFRSLVVPLKAMALNLLSVAAAYGALVLVFQHGIGAAWLGFRQVPVVEAWIPLFLFTMLYGLSMDYHVFLLSRMRERFDATGDNTDAVVHGLRSTARVIGGAAAIMVAVFAGFAAGELVMFQQVGFGLAVALLLDATLVRLVLVPAAMTVLGARNWYAPAWLGGGRG